MVLVKYASRCDVTIYESLADPAHGSACGIRSAEYTEWPMCRACHDHVCPTHRCPNTFESEEGRETVLCPSCGWKARP